MNKWRALVWGLLAVAVAVFVVAQVHAGDPNGGGGVGGIIRLLPL